jgi:hypothetical protein
MGKHGLDYYIDEFGMDGADQEDEAVLKEIKNKNYTDFNMSKSLLIVLFLDMRL